MQQIVSAAYHLFRHYGLAGISASMFIENIGIPFPIEVGYLAAVSIIAEQEHGTAVVLSALTFGHLAGATTAYLIGRRGDAWLRRRFSGRTRFAEAQQRLVRWYDRYGSLTIFATRFIGYVRPWSSFVAGFAGFPLAPFALLTALGSLIFNLIALSLSRLLLAFWRKYTGCHLLIAVVITASFLGMFFWELLRQRGGRQGTAQARQPEGASKQ